MQIELELRNHCIQTAAKRTYEQMLNRYLSRNAEDDEAAILEKQIMGLTYFLQNADFQRLRSEYPDLDGRRHHRVTLEIHGDFKNVKIKWDDQRVLLR